LVTDSKPEFEAYANGNWPATKVIIRWLNFTEPIAVLSLDWPIIAALIVLIDYE
jgi:hypothetical protein